jgi:hypothetical protein
MRKLLFCFVLAAIVSLTSEIAIHPIPHVLASQPEYAKWGELAVQQTSARYQASIVDYLHIGRNEVKPGVAEEKFKLWLRDQKHEFGVLITIQFYTANDQVISIKFQETTR